MERSGKDGQKLEDLASSLAKMVLQSIEKSKLECLIKCGVNPENSKHRFEIVILALFSLKSAILIAQQSSMFNQRKGSELLHFVEQLLKTSYVDVLTLGYADQFENLLEKRYEEYESRDTLVSTIPRIGLRFSRNIGIDDLAIVLWAEMKYRKFRLKYVDFLKMMNDRYDLIC